MDGLQYESDAINVYTAAILSPVLSGCHSNFTLQ